jgi:hypothetical protein
MKRMNKTNFFHKVEVVPRYLYDNETWVKIQAEKTCLLLLIRGGIAQGVPYCDHYRRSVRPHLSSNHVCLIHQGSLAVTTDTQ